MNHYHYVPRLFLLIFFLLIFSLSFASENRALVIGISQYTEVNSLRYADADATQYAQYLVQFSDYKNENVDLLTNLDAKKETIEKYFEKIAKESERTPFKNFVFIYAGHGVGSKLSYVDGDKENNKSTNVFLVPSDAKLSKSNFLNTSSSAVVTNPTFITTDWLTQALVKIKAEKITVLLDSCYSGNLKFFHTLEYEFYEKENSATKSAPKFAYIASSKEDQEASEYDELGHGALSYAFFEFLKIKRREINSNSFANITYSEFFKNISKLFSEIQINGKPLDSFHQPVLLGLPSLKRIEFDSFIAIKGGVSNEKSTKDASAKLVLQTEFDGYNFLVDGVEYKKNRENLYEIPAGRHLFEYFIPETGYRYSFVRDLVGFQVLNEPINHLGILKININNGSDKSELHSDGVEIYINGKSYGTHKQFATNLLAGTHIVEVKYLNATNKKNVEIRPDSPLTIVYTLEAKKESNAPKNVKNVLF